MGSGLVPLGATKSGAEAIKRPGPSVGRLQRRLGEPAGRDVVNAEDASKRVMREIGTGAPNRRYTNTSGCTGQHSDPSNESWDHAVTENPYARRAFDDSKIVMSVEMSLCVCAIDRS